MSAVGAVLRWVPLGAPFSNFQAAVIGMGGWVPWADYAPRPEQRGRVGGATS